MNRTPFTTDESQFHQECTKLLVERVRGEEAFDDLSDSLQKLGCPSSPEEAEGGLSSFEEIQWSLSWLHLLLLSHWASPVVQGALPHLCNSANSSGLLNDYGDPMGFTQENRIRAVQSFVAEALEVALVQVLESASGSKHFGDVTGLAAYLESTECTSDLLDAVLPLTDCSKLKEDNAATEIALCLSWCQLQLEGHWHLEAAAGLLSWLQCSNARLIQALIDSPNCGRNACVVDRAEFICALSARLLLRFQ